MTASFDSRSDWPSARAVEPDAPWGQGPLPSVPHFEAGNVEAYLRTRPFNETTREFLRTMARDGAAIIQLGDDAERLCDQVIAETDHYFRDGKVSRVADAWIRSAAVRRLATQPQVAQLLRAAYGRQPFAFQTLNFLRGSQQHLHSDVVHFSSQPERFMCGLWIALEDVTLDSGPVIYKPGSHKLPIIKMRDVGVEATQPALADYHRQYVPQFAARMAALQTENRLAVIKKGEALVWAANLAHGGSPIGDPDATRRSLVVHYYFEDCAYYTPLESDEASGALRMRLPHDIGGGRWRWPRRDGKRLPVGWRTVLNALRAKPKLF